MADKKEFLIPENVEEGVKLFGEVKAKELIITLAPSLLISTAIFYSPIDNPVIKLGIIAGLLVIPGYMIIERPVRKNITILYVLKAYIKYMLREKRLTYVKERYHVQTVIEKTNDRGKTKEYSTKSNPIKSSTWGVIDNNR